MFWWLLIPILLWALVMAILIIPGDAYSSFFDRLTRGKWRKDRVNLAIMLEHLRNNPEDWSISRDRAAFPKEGAKQIMLEHDRSGNWSYALTSFGGSFRPLNGHFAHEFDKELTRQNNAVEERALLRHFYPELNGTLLLK
jgi:hypothetical protein